jgi:hypothetical protein
MNKRMIPEPARDLRTEVQLDLLGRNAFVMTMIGSVAFVLACVSVIWT